LLIALAIALLTMLSAAAEKTGLDKMLKANTVAKRTHSLFRQGLMLWDRIPNEKEERLVCSFTRSTKSFASTASSGRRSESCEHYTHL
jgi:hypothetical protein